MYSQIKNKLWVFFNSCTQFCSQFCCWLFFSKKLPYLKNANNLCNHCFIHYFIHWWSSLVLSRKVATKNWFLAHICVATCYSVCVLCTVCTGTWRRTCRLYRPRWRRSGSGGVPGTESTSTTSTGTYRQNPGLRIKIVLWCNKKFK